MLTQYCGNNGNKRCLTTTEDILSRVAWQLLTMEKHCWGGFFNPSPKPEHEPCNVSFLKIIKKKKTSLAILDSIYHQSRPLDIFFKRYPVAKRVKGEPKQPCGTPSYLQVQNRKAKKTDKIHHPEYNRDFKFLSKLQFVLVMTWAASTLGVFVASAHAKSTSGHLVTHITPSFTVQYHFVS